MKTSVFILVCLFIVLCLVADMTSGAGCKKRNNRCSAINNPRTKTCERNGIRGRCTSYGHNKCICKTRSGGQLSSSNTAEPSLSNITIIVSTGRQP